MNKLVLFAVLLCLVVVNARHYGEQADSETLRDDDSQADFKKDKERNSPPRHRKRRWQNYGYDYQPPPYYADRRDSYNNNYQELIPQIYRLLEEISTHIRRPQQVPPPPPQPIYVPYPMPFFVPKYMPCKPAGANVTVTPRFPELADINQNWGFVINDLPEDVYDDSDGMRPISFDPIKPKQNNLKRPAPAVEHGSSQSNIPLTTQAPVFDDLRPPASATLPSMCNAAILSCCSISVEAQKRECFTSLGCAKTYSKGGTCTSKSIKDALEAIKNTYSPVN